jgi:hypothetical protein
VTLACTNERTLLPSIYNILFCGGVLGLVVDGVDSDHQQCDDISDINNAIT